MAKSSKSIMNSYKKQYQKSQKQWNKMTGFPVNKKKNFYDKYTIAPKPYKPKKSKPINVDSYVKLDKSINTGNSNNGCYIATCVYGSYDCPEVWTLRRFRDYILDKTWYGRGFVKCYYAISPTLVKLFGNKKWFKSFWKKKIDAIVLKLNILGIENTSYIDK